MEVNDNIPDKYLKIGAWLVITTCIIAIVGSVIVALIALVATSNIINISISNYNILIIFLVIIAIVIIVGSAFFIRWGVKVLKGNSKDEGCTLGIIFIVLSSISILAFLVTRDGSSSYNLISGGLGLAGGILLVKGKYLKNQSSTNIVEQIDNNDNK